MRDVRKTSGFIVIVAKSDMVVEIRKEEFDLIVKGVDNQDSRICVIIKNLETVKIDDVPSS